MAQIMNAGKAEQVEGGGYRWHSELDNGYMYKKGPSKVEKWSNWTDKTTGTKVLFQRCAGNQRCKEPR